MIAVIPAQRRVFVPTHQRPCDPGHLAGASHHTWDLVSNVVGARAPKGNSLARAAVRFTAQIGRRSIRQQELQQRYRLVQFRPVVASLPGPQAREQDDLGLASQVVVAPGQLRRVGRRWHQQIRIAMQVQNLHPGLCEWGKIVDRVEFAGAGESSSSSDRP